MSFYVDGFVLPLPKSHVDRYQKVSKVCQDIWREYGAVDYVECLADDVKSGEINSFPQSVILKDDETVVFAWITYKSREDRDRCNEKVMADPRLKDLMDKDLFDGKRMIYGGFKTIVQ
ncbi:MAG: DUF1428 domain-containing protein [Proteobacteria bacterium]|nr:MAG: DUF1428 domain-containing protein [Pseudomonadota bacterium]